MQKLKLSSFTHAHVFPNLKYFLFTVGKKQNILRNIIQWKSVLMQSLGSNVVWFPVLSKYLLSCSAEELKSYKFVTV